MSLLDFDSGSARGGVCSITGDAVDSFGGRSISVGVVDGSSQGSDWLPTKSLLRLPPWPFSVAFWDRVIMDTPPGCCVIVGCVIVPTRMKRSRCWFLCSQTHCRQRSLVSRWRRGCWQFRRAQHGVLNPKLTSSVSTVFFARSMQLWEVLKHDSPLGRSFACLRHRQDPDMDELLQIEMLEPGPHSSTPARNTEHLIVVRP